MLQKRNDMLFSVGQASVVGALSRDVIFARVAPSTYALQAMVTHHT